MMKRVLYFGLLIGFAAIGWLLLTKPVGAEPSDTATPTSHIPTATFPVNPDAGRLPSVFNGLVQSESERFFQTGREMGDREIERLMHRNLESPAPLLNISPDPGLPPDTVPLSPEVNPTPH